MLVYVGFPDEEIALLKAAAEKLDVLHRCIYVDHIEKLDADASDIELNGDQHLIPAVIFLNLDVETDKWKTPLLQIKAHEKIKGLPVVGLGRVNDEQIIGMYEMGINSYIRKPETFGEMMRAADISLKFWLEVSLVPGKIIADN